VPPVERVSFEEAFGTLTRLAAAIRPAESEVSPAMADEDPALPGPPAPVLVDPHGLVQSFSAQAESLFGRSGLSVLGTPVADLVRQPLENESTFALPSGQRVRAWRCDGFSKEGTLWLFQRRDDGRAGATALRYRNLVEQIPAVVFTATLEGGLTDIYVSPQVQSMLGYSQEEWLGNPVLWYERLYPDDRRLLDAEFARGCLTGGPFKAQCRFLSRDGRVVWVHGEARLIKDPRGVPMLLQGVAFDISESKRAEETVRASLREKETLLKEIHHRVKNNLQVTSSLLRLQTEGVADEGARRALGDSQNRIRSMALVHELLYRSKDLSRVDLADYVRDVSRQLLRSQEIDPARITIDLRLDTALVVADLAVPCGLLLNELLSNCLKHAFPDRRRGCIQIEVRAQPGRLSLTVADDGIGLTGTGAAPTSLGLRLVHTLADQVGGKLEVKSEPGRGTNISLVVAGWTEAGR
jgi:PAS domain S-box-containing protein